jgi:hypothetical protein
VEGGKILRAGESYFLSRLRRPEVDGYRASRLPKAINATVIDRRYI